MGGDPEFVRITQEEALRIVEAENSGFVDEKEIDWDDLSVYDV